MSVFSRLRRVPEYRLLLLDDNMGDVDLVREKLSTTHDFKLTIDAVATLAEAVEMTRQHAYDSLIVDLNLPDSQGLDTVRELRRACPDTAIVVLSGIIQEDLRQEALRAGAQDFLSKEATGDDIVAQVMLYSLERHRVEALTRRKDEERLEREELERWQQRTRNRLHQLEVSVDLARTRTDR
jgi:DNA-binding NarL/FixJ family response regulator